jgi:hypothetical protein
MFGFENRWHEGDGIAELRRELIERSVPSRASWWGFDGIQIDDPDSR